MGPIIVARGWQPRKFVVIGQRGELPDGETFVLVPGRDPAAISAIVAYARSTPDVDLAIHLREWADRSAREMGLEDEARPDPSPSWIATLADDVQAGRLDVQTGLVRLARLMRDGR